jgi:hypothetical protein
MNEHTNTRPSACSVGACVLVLLRLGVAVHRRRDSLVGTSPPLNTGLASRRYTEIAPPPWVFAGLAWLIIQPF